MTRRTSFDILRRPAVLALAVLVVLSISRLLLILVNWERVSATGGLGHILQQGIRFDLVFIGQALGPVFLFKPWFHARPGLRRIGGWLWPLYLGAVAGLAFLVEAASHLFIVEFDSRPNYLFVEYLVYPRELLATLPAIYLWEFAAIIGIALVLFTTVARWLRADPAADQRIAPVTGLWLTLLAALATLAMVRGTLDHHPINPSIAAFSQDSMVNQLPLNSPYSVLYAIYEHNRDSEGAAIRYGHMEPREVLDIIRTEAGLSWSEPIDPDLPTLHYHQATHHRATPLNIVIILEESLGAEFVGSLGGKDLTPELDALAQQGIWFDQLFATGTRSVRGIEAVVTGFTPTPQLSVVKRADTQQGFFSLAELLRNNGYRTSFLYGGSAHFDNMKRFFLNNGFQTVIEQKDFENPEFVGPWGVADEELFQRAHKEFSDMGQGPFFSLVFTTTHHKPFDVPPGRIPPETGPDGARETAVRYADYALGQFFQLAQASPYWDDTVFLVIADHNSRVYGDQLVPVERFRIPGLILGGSIDPRRVPGISSQIDMLPTLLSLAGVSGYHPAIGRDLTRPEYRAGAGRAMMQFYSLQAYLEGERVVVLQPGLQPSFHRREVGVGLVDLAPPDRELERKALAYALWGPLMISRQAYRLD